MWEWNALGVAMWKCSNTPFQRSWRQSSRQYKRRVVHVEIPRAYCLVVSCFKVFCEVVGKVFLARVPSDIEIPQGDLVCDAKETHFHGT